jgi:hypothetical protein
MRVQDEERRKLSVELHDGLGQGITATKMTAGRIATTSAADWRFSGLEAMLEDSLQQPGRCRSYCILPCWIKSGAWPRLAGL